MGCDRKRQVNVVYAHEFGDRIRSSAFKYYPGLKDRLGGTIVGVNGREDVDGLKRRLKELSPDVVLVRGDMSDLYRAPLQLGIPYVVCENDVSSWRKGVARRERQMLESAVGVVFTSDSHREYLAGVVNLPDTLTVWLRPTLASLDFQPMPKVVGKSLVYAGGLGVWSRRTSPWGYRAYHRVFEAFLEAGWSVHVYPAIPSGPVTREYTKLGCQVHGTVKASGVLPQLSQYDAGLHGYAWHDVPARSLEYAMSCMPNKTWEYLSAGISTVSVNGGVSGDLIADGGWGVKVSKDLSGLDALELPVVTDSMRRSQTIDADLDRLAQFIKAAV